MNASEVLSRVASLAPSAITKPEDVLLTEKHTAVIRWDGQVWGVKVGRWSTASDGHEEYHEARYTGIEGEGVGEVLRNALQKLALAGV